MPICFVVLTDLSTSKLIEVYLLSTRALPSIPSVDQLFSDSDDYFQVKGFRTSRKKRLANAISLYLTNILLSASNNLSHLVIIGFAGDIASG